MIHLSDAQRENVRRSLDVISRYGIGACPEEFADFVELLRIAAPEDATFEEQRRAYEVLFRDILADPEHDMLVADTIEDIVTDVLNELDKTENGVYLGPRVG